MINSLEIKNFQSHINSILTFHPGVNIIIGSSDEGKSVILRVIEWIRNNRPMGLSYISHWNIDEKDNIENSIIGKIIIDDNEIIRKRTNCFNGYIVNNKVLETGIEVPDEVRKIFNFTDINIQKQFDSPFLLSKGAGEVARFFNETIKIDDIDRMLSLVENKKRKSKSDLKYIENDLKEINKELNKLKWIDKAGIIIRKLERIIDKVNEYNEKISILEDLINKKIRIRKRIIEYSKIQDCKKYFDEIDKINDKIIEQENKIELLESIANEYEKIKEKIKDNEREINELREQFPDKCPTCGQEIKKGVLL